MRGQKLAEVDLASAIEALGVLTRYFEQHSQLAPGDKDADLLPLAKSRLRQGAKAHLELCLLRKEILGPDISSEYCWAILMAIYLSQSDGVQICVTDIVYATGIPAASVIRWLAMLNSRGVVARSPDKKDGRRTWISLEPVGVAMIENYFAIEIARNPSKTGKCERRKGH